MTATPYRTLGDLDLFGVEPDTGVEWSVQGPASSDWWNGGGTTLSVTQRARGHGGWAGDAFYPPAHFVISGIVSAPTQTAMRDAIDRLHAAASLSDTTLTVVEESTTRAVTVRRSDDVIVTMVHPTLAQWSVQLVAVDPRRLAAGEGAEQIGWTGPPSATGGLVLSTTAVRHNLVAAPRRPTVDHGWSSWRFAGVSGEWTYPDVDTGLGFTDSGRYTVVEQTAESAIIYIGPSTTIPVTGGDSLLVGVLVWQSGDQPCTIRMEWFNESGTVAWQSTGTASTAPADGTGSWRSLRSVAPEGAVQARITVGWHTATEPVQAGDWLQATAWIAEISEVGLSRDMYFDGGSVNATWDGNEGASTSTLRTGDTTVPFVIASTVETGEVVLVNAGNTGAPVWVQFDGEARGPQVIHQQTGAVFAFSSQIPIGPYEWLLVDMESHQALAQGTTSRARFITSRGWHQAVPGVNRWLFSAAEAGEGARMTVGMRSAWL